MSQSFTHLDILDLLRAGTGIDVEFTEGINDLEVYAEPGMRATLLSGVDQGDDCTKVRVSFAKFDEFNKAFESANYFDKSGSAVLTARQANQYDVEDDIYFTATAPVTEFVILDSRSATLMARYKAEATSGLSYVAWLEQQVQP